MVLVGRKEVRKTGNIGFPIQLSNRLAADPNQATGQLRENARTYSALADRNFSAASVRDRTCNLS